MPLSSGSRLGSYEILALLGAGGMGKVYRPKDTTLGRDVALVHDSAGAPRPYRASSSSMRAAATGVLVLAVLSLPIRY